jgi:hypothetical protein
MTMFSISFKYKKSQYQALIRIIKEREEGEKEYRVTIMNGDLEMLLYGNHILKEKNGRIDIQESDLPHHIVELRAVIADALESFYAEEIAN